MARKRSVSADPLASGGAEEVPLEQYRLAFERNPQPMWVYDLDSLSFIAVNDAAIEHYGYSREEFLAMTIRDIRPASDLPAPGQNIEFDLQGLERSGVWRHRKRDGTVIDVEIDSWELTFADRRARVALAHDVTARRNAENAQRAQVVVAQRLAESATLEEGGPKVLDGLGSTMGWDAAVMWKLDQADGVMRLDSFWGQPMADALAQAELEHALGETAFRSGEGWVGRAWESCEPVCEENGPDPSDTTCEAALARASVHREVAVPVLSGEDVLGALEFFSGPHRHIGDDVLRTLTIASAQLGQFLERKRAEQELAYQALHDPLTQLPNRALSVDRLKLALARSRRRRTSVAVLLLDIDNFKVINDSLGHRAGDELLIMLASRIGAALRPGDTVSRFGGDEFVVIGDQIAGDEDAIRLAERINAVFAEPFVLGNGAQFMSASIGIAISRESEFGPEELIRDADSAMHRAKERGRGHYEVFDKVMHARMLGRLRTENELREALRREELSLFYQPVVSLPGCGVVGVEALVRWNHPERGMVPPIEFIGLAEESGLILPIGNWVLRQACRQAAEWRASRPELPAVTVSVNVSAKQVHQGSLDRVVEQVLCETGLDASLLKLELTESVLLEEVDGLHETLDNVNAQGVQLALDDFGTGYSALGYLHRFPIQTLKIDRSFVAGIGVDAKRSAIVQAVIDMARALDIEVVAEGVETAKQARLLFDLGCAYAQGFYFARPAPVEQVGALLGPDVLPLASAPSSSGKGKGKRGDRRRDSARRRTAAVAATTRSA